MMKKWFVILSLLCFVAFVAKAQPVPGILMPFSFSKTDGKAFSKDNLQPNKPTVVMFFDPTCDHCQQQAQWIDAELSKFAEAQLVLVTTNDSKEEVNGFAPKYMPNYSKSNKTSPPIHFLMDTDYKFDRYFGESQVPTLLVYSKTGTLLKRFTKETPAKEIYQLWGGK